MIEPFSEKHFDLIIEWVDSEALMMQYSGPDFDYPWSQEVLSQYLNEVHDRERFIFSHENEPRGYGEILHNGEFQPRLGRLLIGGEENRGKGYGQLLIQDLIAYLQESKPGKPIYLYVYTDNYGAIRAYEKAGFKKVQPAPIPLPEINKSAYLMSYD